MDEFTITRIDGAKWGIEDYGYIGADQDCMSAKYAVSQKGKGEKHIIHFHF